MIRDWPDLAAQALRAPQRLVSLAAWQWEPVIRQARRADVLGRIAAMLQAQGLLAGIPAGPREHLQSALAVVQAQQVQLKREVQHLLAALDGLGVRLVLLKGAAYVLADEPAASGRICADIDILVPRAALPEVEGALMLAGWMGTHHDAYDQRYYREWMHELPPLQHVIRMTTLDVHHNILPLTVRRPPDAALLLASARPLSGYPGASVLDPADMVLHSMTHLFHNDELSHGLRDLSDLDLLLRRYGADPLFWPLLLARARTLHLERALYHGLWATAQALGTPVPANLWTEVESSAAPAWPQRSLMQALWRRGLTTPDPATQPKWSAAARFMLYVRAHWLRMPPGLLARHLARKAWKRLTKGSPAAG